MGGLPILTESYIAQASFALKCKHMSGSQSLFFAAEACISP